jgi:hypothetical protein
MMTIQSFSSNHPLYEDTVTQYGPAYYFITEPIHSLLGLPLTQHGVRFKTAIYWLLCVLCATSIVHRLSGSRSIGLLTGLLTSVHLDKLALEPGHPQELTLFLSLFSLWCVSHANRNSLSLWILSATAVGTVGMIKLNCGFVASLPLLLTCLRALPTTKYWCRWCQKISLILLAILVCLAVGVTMPRIDLQEPIKILACIVPIVLMLSWSAIVYRVGLLIPTRQCTINAVSPFGPVVLTLAFISALFLGWTRWNNTPWTMVYWGMVGQHTTGFAQTFFHPIIASPVPIAVALTLIVSRRNRFALSLMVVFCFVSVVGLTLFTLLKPLEHGLVPRGASQWLSIVGPALSIGLLDFRKRVEKGRIALAGFTALSPWIAFPTPGTQVMIGTVPAILTLGVLLADSIHYSKSITNNRLGFQSLPRMGIAICVGVGISSCVVTAIRWRDGSSLAQPGSEWIHIAPQLAAQERAIADRIRETGAEYLVFDGHTHNRFFFWTKCKPLTAANPTFWPQLLTQRDQQKWQSEIEKCKSLCVLIPLEADLLARGKAESLRQTMRANTQFKEIGSSGWKIGVRRQIDE